jgi:hypothetical protein
VPNGLGDVVSLKLWQLTPTFLPFRVLPGARTTVDPPEGEQKSRGEEGDLEEHAGTIGQAGHFFNSAFVLCWGIGVLRTNADPLLAHLGRQAAQGRDAELRVWTETEEPALSGFFAQGTAVASVSTPPPAPRPAAPPPSSAPRRWAR